MQKRADKPIWALIGVTLCLCYVLLTPTMARQAANWVTPERKLIALTFDDGPQRTVTTALLDGLKERGTRVTFFPVGNRIENMEDLLLRMKDEGHQVGLHTWEHEVLLDLGDEAFYHQVETNRQRLQELLGEGQYALRPPFGKVDQGVTNRAGSPIILWTVDPRDWDDPKPGEITQRVLAEISPGDIVLLHDIYPNTVIETLDIVDALQSQGYEFVTVEELFFYKGIVLQNGNCYASAG